MGKVKIFWREFFWFGDLNLRVIYKDFLKFMMTNNRIPPSDIFAFMFVYARIDQTGIFISFKFINRVVHQRTIKNPKTYQQFKISLCQVV